MSPADQGLPPWRPLLKHARLKEGHSPMGRWLQLASIGPDGSPRVRTLVFRGWWNHNSLELLTDGRSAKQQELQRDPRFELCWLLPKAQSQFRLRGHQHHLDRDERMQRQRHHWLRLQPEARALWGWPPPGQELDSAGDWPTAIPNGTTMPDSFALLRLEITHVDLLELTQSPHRRRCWSAEDGWKEVALNP